MGNYFVQIFGCNISTNLFNSWTNSGRHLYVQVIYYCQAPSVFNRYQFCLSFVESSTNSEMC